MKNSIEYLEEKSYQYRKRFLDIFTKIGFGHVTSAFSWTEIAVVLYHEIMDINPDDMYSEENDKLFIGKGHGSGMLFPIYEDFGVFADGELEASVQIGGSNEKIKGLFYPGFDFYGGSLGMGLGLASGYAKGIRLSNRNNMAFCLIGDAECYEGSVWEAALFAGHNRLSNLVAIVDRNGLGCSDFTEHMLSMEPFGKKWESCNWETLEIDGHDIRQVYDALDYARGRRTEKPICIIANTKKGKGLEYLVDRPLMHGYMPKGEDDINKAYAELENGASIK